MGDVWLKRFVGFSFHLGLFLPAILPAYFLMINPVGFSDTLLGDGHVVTPCLTTFVSLVVGYHVAAQIIKLNTELFSYSLLCVVLKLPTVGLWSIEKYARCHD